MSSGFETYGLHVIKDFIVQCNNCKNVFSITPEEIEYSTNYEDAPMGTRVYYMFCTECSCPGCGHTITYKQFASEYPETAIENISNPECIGGSILQLPEIGTRFYDDELYVTETSIYTDSMITEPQIVNPNRQLNVNIFDGDAYTYKQFFNPEKSTGIWLNPSGRLLQILVDETGSIRFKDNAAQFVEVLLRNPQIGAMRLLGKVAEAVIVKNCN